jgi:hypothetical protein
MQLYFQGKRKASAIFKRPHSRSTGIESSRRIFNVYAGSMEIPADSLTISLSHGLTENEWQIWKSNVSSFSALTVEEERKIREFTGLLPAFLYKLGVLLNELDNEMTIEQKLFAFSQRYHEMRQASLNLTTFSNDMFSSSKKNTFITMMMAALNGQRVEIDNECYDHRYFYEDSQTNSVLVPASGFVLKKIANILAESNHSREDYLHGVNLDWLRHGLINSNPSARELCFKEYHICRMIKEKTVPGFVCNALKEMNYAVPDGLQIEVTRFLGHRPEWLEITTGAYLYVSLDYQNSHVDAILRIVITGKIFLFGFNITLHTPQEERNSFLFFHSRGLYLNFVNDNEVPTQCWLVWLLNKEGEKVGKIPDDCMENLEEIVEWISIN